MIDSRAAARLESDLVEERRLHSEIRKRAKLDRTRWLEALLANGDWDATRRFRKPKQAKLGKLRNAQGEIVERDQWADTMALHLKKPLESVSDTWVSL